MKQEVTENSQIVNHSSADRFTRPQDGIVTIPCAFRYETSEDQPEPSYRPAAINPNALGSRGVLSFNITKIKVEGLIRVPN
jgi:hypothetical protein